MSEWIASALLVIGAGFMFVASIGIVRMPDTLTRMHAATKAGTVGLACTMLAVAVHLGTADAAIRSILVVAFIVLTAPVAAHLIARAAYCTRVELWGGTTRDDLRASGTLDAMIEAERERLREQPGPRPERD